MTPHQGERRMQKKRVRNFSLSLINKLFAVFYLPQFEGAESREEAEENREESHTAQGKSLPTLLSTDSEHHCEERREVIMVNTPTIPDEEKGQEENNIICHQEEDLEIGSLYSHSMEESMSAISTTQGQEAVYVDPEMLAILPTYLGTEKESPIQFLREFDKICRAQKRPEGSSEEDLKLRIIPISLKGSADAWFRGLEPNCIRTWSGFREEFLYKFIPAARVRALRREISEIAQGHGESMGNYCTRACWKSVQLTI